MCAFVSPAFKYVDRHWVKREIDEGGKGVYRYEDTSLLLWKRNVLDPEPRLSLKILDYIRQHREYRLSRPPVNFGSADAVDVTSAALQSVLRPVLDSFACVPKFVLDTEGITSYKTDFHALFLDHTDKYYQEVHQRLLLIPGNDPKDDELGSLSGLSIRDSDSEYFDKVCTGRLLSAS
jgi:hypothetical protein